MLKVNEEYPRNARQAYAWSNATFNNVPKKLVRVAVSEVFSERSKTTLSAKTLP